MPIETILLFLITDLAFCFTPGPATMVTVSHALPPAPAGGFRGAAGPIMGIHAGNCIWYALTAFGLIALIQAAPSLYGALRWAGVAYLLWMGGRMVWQGASALSVTQGQAANFWRGFRSGLAVHMANPKAMIFYAAFIPQFIDPARDLAVQFLILAGITVVTESAGLLFYTALASGARRFATSGRAVSRMQRLSGAILIIVALLLGFSGLGTAASAGAAIAKPSPPDPVSEQVQALHALNRLDQRVHTAGYRLITANAQWCARTAAFDGMMVHQQSDYDDPAAAAAAFDLAPGDMRVAAVAPGSPAQQAGVQVGDAILTRDPAMLIWRRGETELRAEIAAPLVCTSGFVVDPSTKFDASANGKRVRITSAWVEYMADDEELAAVLAHELAHNLLDHPARLKALGVDRGLLGQLGKSAGQIKATEIEADRLSVWLMANAGYDPHGAVRFWSRYGPRHDKGIFSAPTHYRWKKRVALITAEIAAMQAVPLVAGKRAPPLLTAYRAAQ